MTTSETLIIAGATGYGVWPANSVEGARRCVAASVDGIEIDVQMTADGHVIAHHDYWLSPSATRQDGQWLTAKGPPLKTMTLAQLAPYDVGSLLPDSDYARRYGRRQPMDGVAIPTLQSLFDTLRLAEGPRRKFYIEIKTDPTNPDASPEPEAITQAVIDAAEAADYLAHTKIIAFDWRVIRLAQARNRDLATAHLTIPVALAGGVTRPPEQDSPWRDGFDPRHHGGSDLAAIKAHGGMEWSPYFTDVTAETMAEAAALGLRVGPWGLAIPEDIDRMISLGVFSATVSGPYWGR